MGRRFFALSIAVTLAQTGLGGAQVSAEPSKGLR